MTLKKLKHLQKSSLSISATTNQRHFRLKISKARSTISAWLTILLCSNSLILYKRAHCALICYGSSTWLQWRTGVDNTYSGTASNMSMRSAMRGSSERKREDSQKRFVRNPTIILWAHLTLRMQGCFHSLSSSPSCFTMLQPSSHLYHEQRQNMFCSCLFMGFKDRRLIYARSATNSNSSIHTLTSCSAAPTRRIPLEILARWVRGWQTRSVSMWETSKLRKSWWSTWWVTVSEASLPELLFHTWKPLLSGRMLPSQAHILAISTAPDQWSKLACGFFGSSKKHTASSSCQWLTKRHLKKLLCTN